MKTLGKFEIEFHSDGTCYRAVIKDVVKNEHAMVYSPTFEGRESMRLSLTAFMQNIAYVLRHRTWPDDTIICDRKMTKHGTVLVNPRYPEPVPTES